MVMFYPAEGCRCGHCHAAPPAGAYPEGPDYAPEDGPLPSDSPCAGPGGACGCYGEGYAAGRDKAHFEVSCPGRRPAPRVRLRLRVLPYHRCGTRGLAGPVRRGDVVGVNYDGPSFGLGEIG